MDKNLKQELSGQEFTRLANNFYNSVNFPPDYQRISIDSQLVNYISSHREEVTNKYKVALVFICLNSLYWEYAKNMVDSARTLFLPGHTTDFLFWTDIPEKSDEIGQKMAQAFMERGVNLQDQKTSSQFQNVVNGVIDLRKQTDIKIFPTEPIQWPFPTLLRYNLFLQQEEKLKEYDYIFYCDVDMKFVNVVGDEILGEALTIAPHPGYAIKKELYPPYEPNPESTSYIKRPGRVSVMDGKPRFMPFYAAGGFQGGKSDVFIKAMKVISKNIDKDLTRNYIPIWNDETAWNKYIFDIQTPEEINKTVFLTPSYIYPDSLIKEWYEPFVWGCSYTPRLVTLTKWFSLSKEGGEHVAKMIQK